MRLPFPIKSVFYLFSVGLLFLSFNISAQDRKTRDTENSADEAFSKGHYSEAKKLYSNLVSLYPQNPTYNYRYGASLLFSEPDKSKALKYLDFSTSVSDAPDEAWYFTGLGYHYNYRFDEALKYYEKFNAKASNRKKRQYPVQRQMRMAENGKKLLKTIVEPHVKNITQTSIADFHLSYALESENLKLIRQLDELRTKADKKNNYFSLMYKHADHDEIWYSSYGDDHTGDLNIFKVKIDSKGNFSSPEKLPEAINSAYDDAYPFYNYNTNTLYFSSKGHTSMGGYDLFSISYNPQTNSWGTAQNMDYAFNTPDNDFLYLETDNTAFFTSSRNNNEGRVTVYEIEPAERQLRTAYLIGTFEKGLYKGAEVTVTDTKNNTVVQNFNTDEETGRYTLTLNNNSKYIFTVKPKGSNTSHQGDVRIPKINSAKPLIQNMRIIETADEEKLIINNRFNETPQNAELMADYFSAIANLQKVETRGVDEAPENDAIRAALENKKQEYEKSANQISKEADRATALAQEKLEEAEKYKVQLEQNTGSRSVEQDYTNALAAADAAAHYAIFLQNRSQTMNQRADELAQTQRTVDKTIENNNREETVKLYSQFINEHPDNPSKNDDAAYEAYLKSAEKSESKAKEYRSKSEELQREKEKLKTQLNFLNSEKNRTKKKREQEKFQNEINLVREDLESINHDIEVYERKERYATDEAEQLAIRTQTLKMIRPEISRSPVSPTPTDALALLEKAEKEKKSDLPVSVQQSELDKPETALVDKDNLRSEEGEKEVSQPGIENKEAIATDNEIKETEELSDFEKLRAQRLAKREREINKDSTKAHAQEETNTERLRKTNSKSTAKNDSEPNLATAQTETDESKESTSTAADYRESTVPEGREDLTGGVETAEQDRTQAPLAETQPEYKPPAYEAHYEEVQNKIDNILDPTAQALAQVNATRDYLDATRQESAQLRAKRPTSSEDLRNLIDDRLETLENREKELEDTLETAEKEFYAGHKPNAEFNPGEEFEESFTIQDIEDKFFFEYETLDEKNPTAKAEKSIDITRQYILELESVKQKLEARESSLPGGSPNKIKIKRELRYIEDAIELKNRQITYNETLLAQSEIEQYSENIDVSLPKTETLYSSTERTRIDETAQNETAFADTKNDEPTRQDTPQADRKDQESATRRKKPTAAQKTKSKSQNPVVNETLTNLNEEQTKYEKSVKKAEKDIENARENLEGAKRRNRREAELNLNNAQAELSIAQRNLEMTSILKTKVEEIVTRPGEAQVYKSLEDSAQAARDRSARLYREGEQLRDAGKAKEAQEKIEASGRMSKRALSFEKLAQRLKEIETEAAKTREIHEPADYEVPDGELIAFESAVSLTNEEQIELRTGTHYREYEQAENKFRNDLLRASTQYDDARDMEYKGAQLNRAAQRKKQEGASEAEIKAVEEEAQYLYEQAQKQKKLAAEQRREAIVTFNLVRQGLLDEDTEESNRLIALINQRDEDIKSLASTPISALDSKKSFTEATIAEEGTPGSRETTVAQTPEKPTSAESEIRATDERLTKTAGNEKQKRSTAQTTAAAFSMKASGESATGNAPLIPFITAEDAVTYRVQVAAFRERVSTDYFPFEPMSALELPNGIIRYLAGNFNNRNTAEQAKQQIQQAGYPDAFVVAYRGNENISLAAAASSVKPTAERPDATVNQPTKTAESSQGTITAPQTLTPQTGVRVQVGDLADVENRGQFFYTVQVGVYSTTTPFESLPRISPMNKEDLGTGVSRYSTGVFTDLDKAVQAKNNIQNTVPDAFVTAYFNGERVSIERAKELGSDQNYTLEQAPEQTRERITQPEKQETDVRQEPVEEKTTQTAQDVSIRDKEDDSREQTKERKQEAPKGIKEGQLTVEVGPYEGNVPVADAREILQLSKVGVNIQKSGGSTFYQIGIFDDNEEAEKLARSLRRKGLREAKVIEYKK